MKRLLFAAVLALCLSPAAARACTLVVSYPSGKVLAEKGECGTRYTPMSSFKFPLAVMGFDSGILKDKDTPVWPWPKDDPEVMDMHRKDSSPEIWMKDSVVWYSQRLTREMGMEKFRAYVDKFAYGNRNLDGKDALTQSWLMSSLEISPEEQVSFLKRFMDRDLGVSDKAYELAEQVMPEFTAGDWKVQGKTGSGWLRHEDGTRNVNRPLGWFIGWARKGDETVLFARLFMGDKPVDGYAGPQARSLMLHDLPEILKAP